MKKNTDSFIFNYLEWIEDQLFEQKGMNNTCRQYDLSEIDLFIDLSSNELAKIEELLIRKKIRHCFFGAYRRKMVNWVSASAEAPHIEASTKRNQYPT
jgi:hypothetical protein